jgi:hypothetical protein
VRTTRNRLALFSAIALLAACAPAKGRSSSLAPAADVYVMVSNQNWLDIDVFAVRGASRIRIGQVTGSGSARLKIPANAIVGGQIQLMADPIGSSERYVTEVITVAPDQRVELTVASAMRMSSYSVIRR